MNITLTAKEFQQLCYRLQHITIDEVIQEIYGVVGMSGTQEKTIQDRLNMKVIRRNYFALLNDIKQN